MNRRASLRPALIPHHGTLTATRPFASAFLLFACLAFAGFCGGDRIDPIPIRGSERLTWDQKADSREQLNFFTFTVYIDGAGRQLGDVRCSEGSTAAGYECSGALPALDPGRHMLQVTSAVNGLESSRSAALAVIVESVAQSPLFTTSLPQASFPGEALITACPVGAAPMCFEVRVIASHLGTVTALSGTPDGRVFVADDQQTLRIIAGGGIVFDSRLMLPESARIVGLTTDADFASTKLVYVGWTEDKLDGSTSLNVTRYREVGSALGEAATIVTGLPFPTTRAFAPLSMGRNGLLYVALPQVGDTDFGMLARFTSGGLVPQSNPRASPTVAYGFARPSGIAVDPSAGTVWLSGIQPTWSDPIGAFNPLDTSAWPIMPRQLTTLLALRDQVPSSASALALFTGGQTQRRQLLVVWGGRLFSGFVKASGELEDMTEVPMTPQWRVVAVASTPAIIYAAIESDGGVTSIVALRAR
jgi:hypothetical protein